MGRDHAFAQAAWKCVSVSALSDHLMGQHLTSATTSNVNVSVSALSDHLMGPRRQHHGIIQATRFSIRSFGSFDGTWRYSQCI